MTKKRAVNSEKEIQQKIRKCKDRLDQLQQMKQILIAEGLKPDAEDKQRESRLIQQLLGYEKDLGRMKKGGEAPKPPRQAFAKSKAKAAYGRNPASN